MKEGLLGRKVGMTRIFDELGNQVPVTVLKAGPCTVIRKKTEETDGYSAIVLGFETAEPLPEEKDRLRKRQRRWLNRPMTGYFKKSFGDSEAKYFHNLREVRLPEPKVDLMDVGEEIKVDLFAAGEFVDVCATSKGRGFAGGMKRHNWKGSQTMSHGTHEYFRHGGAVSSNTYPGRLFKGRRMPGQMGNERVTIQNLRVVAADPAQDLLFVRGSIPGPNGGLVFVSKAKKKKS